MYTDQLFPNSQIMPGSLILFFLKVFIFLKNVINQSFIFQGTCPDQGLLCWVSKVWENHQLQTVYLVISHNIHKLTCIMSGAYTGIIKKFLEEGGWGTKIIGGWNPHENHILHFSRAQNLRQSIVIKPSIGNKVLWMGSGSFVDTIICVRKYFYMRFLHFSLFSDFKIYANV